MLGSPMSTLYLDNAATTPLSDEVRAAMAPFHEQEFGNPSARYPLGVEASEAIELARTRVARAVGGRPEDVVFTSGGTEANNLAVLGLARARRRHGRHVLVGPTEHPSVRESARALEQEGFEVGFLRLDEQGELDLDHLAGTVRNETVVVAQMLVNNEFGTAYPVARVGRLVRANAPQAVLHVDAIQGLGKLHVSIGELGAHSLSISAHKIHGPKGAGALVLSEGVRPRPLLYGGAQERGLRSGTENVAGIVGLGRAAELAAERVDETARHMRSLREILTAELARTGLATVLEPGATRSPAIVSLLLPGPPAEVWMHHLETRGVMTSVGSACQAKSRDVSPALRALGLNEEQARRVLRLSFSSSTQANEVRAAAQALAQVERELGTPDMKA